MTSDEKSTAAEVPAFSPARDLREAFQRMKQRRIRVSVARSTRAGSIGNPCERYIYYERTVPATQRVPHDVGKQELFDLGNAIEPWIIREIEDAGLEVVGRQRDWYDADLEIGGRGDVRVAKRSPPLWPRPVVVEIKGMAPYAAEGIRSVKDIRDHRSPWVRRYYDQEQVYLRFDGGDVGLFALANKLSGHVEFVDCPRDRERIALLEAKAARVRDAVRAGVPPPRNESEDCARCPFNAVCGPGRNNAGVQIFDSDEVAALIAKRLELADAKAEFESIDRRLKSMLPEVPELLVAGYVVKARQVQRKGFTVEAGSFWQRTYLKVR